jgi:hypothetical protein
VRVEQIQLPLHNPSIVIVSHDNTILSALKTLKCKSTLYDFSLSASLSLRVLFSLISRGCSLYRKPSPQMYNVKIIFWLLWWWIGDTTCSLCLFKCCLSRPVEPCINFFLFFIIRHISLPVAICTHKTGNIYEKWEDMALVQWILKLF